MQQMFQRLAILAAAAVLAACANTPRGPGGKHLVYRDTAGAPIWQFDYPTDDFCRRVEAVAGRNARCQAESVGTQLQARATLRYNPPGVMVEGHYPTLAKCQSDTAKPPPGVEVINACTAK